jgi:pimeloyl-ACP methyl ester carboxylesterase
MNRREVLTSGAVAAVGAGILAACREAGGVPGTVPAATTRPRRRAGSFIEAADGTSLFHLDWGQGKPVLFVHAWALSADIWEYQMTELAESGLRCVAYDRRGHGRSADSGRGYDFDTLADDLAAVIEQLDLDRVTLVGHSMGGGEIVRYLARHGSSRVARVVLASAITPGIGKSGAFDGFIAMLKQDRPAVLTAGVAKFTGAGRSVSPQMSAWVVSQFLRASPRATIECMRAVASSDFTADLAAVTVPTLIAHGDADELNHIDQTARRTARAIRGSTLSVYPGAPHGLVLTDRERFNRELLGFIG